MQLDPESDPPSPQVFEEPCAPPSPPHCGRCSVAVEPTMRFCFNCGAALQLLWFDVDLRPSQADALVQTDSMDAAIEKKAPDTSRAKAALRRYVASLKANPPPDTKKTVVSAAELPTNAFTEDEALRPPSPSLWKSPPLTHAGERAFNFLERMKQKTLQERVWSVLNHSKWGKIWDLVQTAAAFTGVVMYIAETYMEKQQGMEEVELVFGAIFLIDLIVNAYISDNRIRYFFEFGTWVNILSLVPLVTFVTNIPMRGVYIVRMFRVLRMVRTYRLMYVTKSGTVARELALVVYLVFTLLFCTAAMFLLIEADTMQNFHTAVYYVVVTFATVGYGDITPQTTAGRMLICAFIMGSLIAIPMRVNRLVDLLRLRSPYAGDARAGPSHIIVTGVCDHNSLVNFLVEFFSPTHGFSKTRVLVLGTGRPSTEMRLLLESSLCVQKVQYLEGSPLNRADLQRCKVETASAVFVLSNKFSSDQRRDDSATILAVLSVRQCNRTIPIFAQSLLSSSKAQLYDIGATVVYCIPEMRAQILAMSCVCPGFTTLLLNLLLAREVAVKPTFDNAWLYEYSQGAAMDLHPYLIEDTLVGKQLHEACRLLYERHGTIVAGVRFTDGTVASNPREYVLVEGDVLLTLSRNPKVATAWAKNTKRWRRVLLATQGGDANFSGATDIPLRVRQRNEDYVFGKGQNREPVLVDNWSQSQSPNGTGKSLRSLVHHMLLRAEDAIVYTPKDVSFHLLPSARSWNTVVVTVLPADAYGHIVVIGMPSNLYHFTQVLRSKSLQQLRTILFVHTTLPPRDELRRVAHFHNVFVLQGDAQNEKTLQACRIRNAHSVVVMSAATENDANLGEQMIDSKVLLLSLRLRRFGADVAIVSVLNSAHNATFLEAIPRARGNRRPGKNRPEIPQNNVVTRPYLEIHDTAHLRGTDIRGETQAYCSPAVASGYVFPEFISEAFLATLYHNRDIFHFLRAFLLIPSFTSDTSQSSLFLIPIPLWLEGCRFEQAYLYFLSQRVICIGLYRTSRKTHYFTPAYVCLAPNKDAIVSTSDWAYVLTDEEPQCCWECDADDVPSNLRPIPQTETRDARLALSAVSSFRTSRMQECNENAMRSLPSA
eukprot:TRINITY_DN14117_c0_g1_i1.p1 TRINITY_DN14117_c0_g1~~TRINITY_DN14117_c0_g1_i1.p1  ORF type:complete len:1108 (+),score=124.65 TRINITY_DN14117_c0_g1_i1:151-3474(+)